MQEKFMRRAIEISRQSLDSPGAMPFAAVVVKDGQIIGEGLNRSLAEYDPVSHGEVEAIRDACRRLRTTSLTGCELYTSCEPCSLCVATMYLVGIERLYYASTSVESASLFRRMAERDSEWTRRISAVDLRREVGLPIDQRSMPAKQLLANEAREVIEAFAKRNS